MFHLDIHAWIEAQQTSHGVRHDDYAQYHGYCTRRLARLAHEKDAKPHLVHSSKFATTASPSTNTETETSTTPDKKKKPKKKASGGASRHAFCSRSHDTLALTVATTTEDDSDDTAVVDVPVPHINILWYLLVSAERSWAHSNQLQKSGTAKRQQVLKKLKRATQWADLLLQKVQRTADASTVKECQAYCAWMSANLAMEKLNYPEASKLYADAMKLCFELSEDDVASSSNERTSDDDERLEAQRLERHDLFMSRAETVLRPLFRYCQYELKQAGEATMEEPRPTGSRDSAKEANDNDDAVVFRDQELVLDNKELRVLLLKLQALDQEETKEPEAQDSSSNETQFLTALSVLDDALDVVQSLENGISKLNAGPAVQAKLQQYALWKGYLQYTKTRKVMEHTERLLVSQNDGGDDAMGPAGKVHVYDSLLQHARSLLALPRPGDGNSAAAEEDEFALQVQANILRLRALKSFQMGWYYFTQLHKRGAALALLEHSSLLCRRALEEIAACDEDMPHSDEYLAELEGLPLKSTMAAVRAALVLQQRQHSRKLKHAGAKNSSAVMEDPIVTVRPLLLRLYDLDGGSLDAPIADLRPMPLPCKPVFYDLAYDYALDPSMSIDAVESFVREHTVAPSTEEDEDDVNETKRSGGILGWFTGS